MTRSAASACTHNDDEGMLSFCAIFPHARQSRHGQGDWLTAPWRLAHFSNSRSKPLSSAVSCSSGLICAFLPTFHVSHTMWPLCTLCAAVHSLTRSFKCCTNDMPHRLPGQWAHWAHRRRPPCRGNGLTGGGPNAHPSRNMSLAAAAEVAASAHDARSRGRHVASCCAPL